MSLKARKQIELIKTDMLPQENQTLREYTGSEMSFEPDWASFENSIDACYTLPGLLTKINNAIEWVARQPIGKQALAEGINRIVIRNVAEASEKSISLNDQVLEIHSTLGSSDYEGHFSDNEIIDFLENTL